jgi:hypothetical protein
MDQKRRQKEKEKKRKEKKRKGTVTFRSLEDIIIYGG